MDLLEATPAPVDGLTFRHIQATLSGLTGCENRTHEFVEGMDLRGGNGWLTLLKHVLCMHGVLKPWKRGIKLKSRSLQNTRSDSRACPI